MSDLQPDGSWGKAVNLGKRINTPYNENTPFFDPASSTLIFSSEGHQGMGGYDTFISTFKNGSWSEAIGLPSPINSTGDNNCMIFRSSAQEYVTSQVDERTGIRNIYRIFPTDRITEKITAEGKIDLQDGMHVIPGLASVKIKSADSVTGWRDVPIKENGKFDFTALKGEYKLHVSYTGYKTDTMTLTIPSEFSGKTLTVSSSLVPEKVSSGDFLALRNILFDYNSFALGEDSRIELQKIIKILIAWPELKIEVTGYTDSRGDREYNLQLSAKRADAVIGFFTEHGIPGKNFSRKAAGASDFVALNENPDGTDNPAGRKYNRRATLGIINPQTGISIRQESYTPPLLRYPYSRKYSIVLLKSHEKYFPDYFKDFNLGELLFVRPVLKDSLYYYILGDFANKSDADSYLSLAKEKGFNESYVADQYALAEEPRQLISQPGPNLHGGEPGIYVIQLKASIVPLKISEFKGINNIREVKGKDKYYRYVYGEYTGFSKVTVALDSVRKLGYGEAFIKDYKLLISQ